MHKFIIEKRLEKILIKLEKKDKITYEQIKKKINEVINTDVEHYKNLMHDLKEFKRVHIGNFVLVFKFDKKNDFIVFYDYDHHDVIYKKKFTS